MTILALLLICYISNISCEVPVQPGCPDPPTTCSWCRGSCPAKNEILVQSPCGCCDNHCIIGKPATVKPVTVKPVTEKPVVCPKCADTSCTRSPCPRGSIWARDVSKPCSCCPSCVIPEEGDMCYKKKLGANTCGPKLRCCFGICRKRCIQP